MMMFELRSTSISNITHHPPCCLVTLNLRYHHLLLIFTPTVLEQDPDIALNIQIELVPHSIWIIDINIMLKLDITHLTHHQGSRWVCASKWVHVRASRCVCTHVHTQACT